MTNYQNAPNSPILTCARSTALDWIRRNVTCVDRNNLWSRIPSPRTEK